MALLRDGALYRVGRHHSVTKALCRILMCYRVRSALCNKLEQNRATNEVQVLLVRCNPYSIGLLKPIVSLQSPSDLQQPPSTSDVSADRIISITRWDLNAHVIDRSFIRRLGSRSRVTGQMPSSQSRPTDNATHQHFTDYREPGQNEAQASNGCGQETACFDDSNCVHSGHRK